MYCGTVENKMAAPQKIKHIITVQSSDFTFGYTPEKTESRDWKKYLPMFMTHVHGSIIHNSQKVQETQVCIGRWMDKQYTISTFTGVLLFSLYKEGNSDTHYNVDEPRREMPSELCQLEKGKHSRIHDMKCLG